MLNENLVSLSNKITELCNREKKNDFVILYRICNPHCDNGRNLLLILPNWYESTLVSWHHLSVTEVYEVMALLYLIWTHLFN